MSNDNISIPFKGKHYNLPNKWFFLLNPEDYENKEIKYLEIGVFYGANIIYFAHTYGKHPETKLYCIDPFEDYDEYDEYKNNQSEHYKTFIENVNNNNLNNKIILKRGYSNIEIPKFDDNYFDIIYIDGNHEPEYVLEDAVLSFRKLRIGGIMIFDDYFFNRDFNHTKKGIDGFLNSYSNRIYFIGCNGDQVFIKKIK